MVIPTIYVHEALSPEKSMKRRCPENVYATGGQGSEAVAPLQAPEPLQGSQPE